MFCLAADALRRAIPLLQEARIEDAARDARVLLAHALGIGHDRLNVNGGAIAQASSSAPDVGVRVNGRDLPARAYTDLLDVRVEDDTEALSACTVRLAAWDDAKIDFAWVDDALFRTETREAFERLVSQGWTDAVRALHPDATIYTYFDYFRNAFQRNAGLRIDHLLLNPALAPRLRAAGACSTNSTRRWPN